MRFDAGAEARLMEAVRDIAGDEILPRFRALDAADIATKTSADDLVTLADERAEARIEEAVAAILPGAAVVGEEAVSSGRTPLSVIAEADLTVIVDPVDGTWNFANGLAVFGVIVAVAERGETIWGGIYDPIGDDWIVARKGAGAHFVTRNGHRNRLSLDRGPTAIGDAFGYVHTFLFGGDDLRRIAALQPDFRRVGNLRCSAHEYRLAGEGRVDFILSPKLNPWDHAAGALIVTEAGGVARLFDGRPYTPTLRAGSTLLAARNETLWQAVRARLDFLP